MAKAPQKTITIQEFLVVFLDVLGQRHELRELRNVPADQEQLTRMLPSLKRTLGFVMMVRDSFQTFFNQYNEPGQLAKSLPNRERMILEALCKSEISFYGFSDSFVVGIPLGTKDDHCTQMNGVHAALLAACWTQHVCLYKEHTIRGGVDVGVGIQLEGGEIYGAALERAYTLESEVADYPRVVVGRELVSYLEYVRDQQTTTNSGKTASLLAEQCLSFIAMDDDGQPILDFLGEPFRKASRGIVMLGMVKKEFEFVTNESQRWTASNDEKLRGRYERLRSYFQQHKKHWEL